MVSLPHRRFVFACLVAIPVQHDGTPLPDFGDISVLHNLVSQHSFVRGQAMVDVRQQCWGRMEPQLQCMRLHERHRVI